MVRLPATMAGSRLSISRLISYAVDWLIIFIFAIIGGVLTFVSPIHRAFSLANPDISFPHRSQDTVLFWVVILVALLAPAIIITIICLIFVPGSTTPASTSALIKWKRKIWEINAGLMGLGMSLAITFFITQGMKLIFGRPRPDLISRCMPDLDNVSQYIVGGLGDLVPQGQYLVSYKICTQPDEGELNDGFMSFPSGHASFSWAGLLYLSLYVCAKFSIAVPWTLPSPQSTSAFSLRDQGNSSDTTINDPTSRNCHNRQTTLRTSTAAPPLYGLVLAIIPVGAAMYITASRFTDYRHHPFDLIIGSTLGSLMAWLSFRWYHAPIRSGAGWAWGPRSVGRSWVIGVGTGSWKHSIDPEWALKKSDDANVAERGEANGQQAGVQSNNEEPGRAL